MVFVTPSRAHKASSRFVSPILTVSSSSSVTSSSASLESTEETDDTENDKRQACIKTTDDTESNKRQARIKTTDPATEASDEQKPSPDLEVINDLIEHIERHPSASQARILLMQQYVRCGWKDAAEEVARQTLEIDSSSVEARNFLDIQKATRNPKSSAKKEDGGKEEARTPLASNPQWRPSLLSVTNIDESLLELESGYLTLQKVAKALLDDIDVARSLDLEMSNDIISDVAAISIGQVRSGLHNRPFESVNVVAQAIRMNRKNAATKGVDIAVDDLEKVYGHHKSLGGSSSDQANDSLRKAMLKRVEALKALLPPELQYLADLAMMHAEHEILQREYVNDETIISSDPISEIPRANFWATEDGYGWDMEELTQALRSGGGVMRNPLSRQMFTTADVRSIIRHPLGQGLRALQVEQSSLKNGVRPQTVGELDKLAKVLNKDMSENGLPSRQAVEEFVVYLETLPETEREAVDKLKVPAKDSHTGIDFDTTIGEAVADMHANRVCSHKTGDFLMQAVNFLK